MMNKLFRKKLTRGGFTLAELLIVVAILAVLVAVAVPIFTNSLDKARISVFKSNERSVKSAGATYILTNWETTYGSAGKKVGDGVKWRVSAFFDAKGDMTSLNVKVLDTTAASSDDGKTKFSTGPAYAAATTTAADDYSNCNIDPGYTIETVVDKIDLESGVTVS